MHQAFIPVAVELFKIQEIEALISAYGHEVERIYDSAVDAYVDQGMSKYEVHASACAYGLPPSEAQEEIIRLENKMIFYKGVLQGKSDISSWKITLGVARDTAGILLTELVRPHFDAGSIHYKYTLKQR